MRRRDSGTGCGACGRGDAATHPGGSGAPPAWPLRAGREELADGEARMPPAKRGPEPVTVSEGDASACRGGAPGGEASSSGTQRDGRFAQASLPRGQKAGAPLGAPPPSLPRGGSAATPDASAPREQSTSSESCSRRADTTIPAAAWATMTRGSRATTDARGGRVSKQAVRDRRRRPGRGGARRRAVGGRGSARASSVRVTLIDKASEEEAGGNTRWSPSYMRMAAPDRVEPSFVHDMLAATRFKGDETYFARLAERSAGDGAMDRRARSRIHPADLLSRERPAAHPAGRRRAGGGRGAVACAQSGRRGFSPRLRGASLVDARRAALPGS